MYIKLNVLLLICCIGDAGTSEAEVVLHDLAMSSEILKNGGKVLGMLRGSSGKSEEREEAPPKNDAPATGVGPLSQDADSITQSQEQNHTEVSLRYTNFDESIDYDSVPYLKRELYERYKEKFLRSRRINITGRIGSGKSVLSKQILSKSTAPLRLLLDGSDEERFTQEFTSVSQVLLHRNKEFIDVEEDTDCISLLSRSNDDWLIVIDDIIDYSWVLDFIEPVLRSTICGQVLLTSRDMCDDSKYIPFRIPELTKEQSHALLEGVLPDQLSVVTSGNEVEEGSTSTEILDFIPRLPLDIVFAGSFIEQYYGAYDKRSAIKIYKKMSEERNFTYYPFRRLFTDIGLPYAPKESKREYYHRFTSRIMSMTEETEDNEISYYPANLVCDFVLFICSDHMYRYPGFRFKRLLKMHTDNFYLIHALSEEFRHVVMPFRDAGRRIPYLSPIEQIKILDSFISLNKFKEQVSDSLSRLLKVTMQYFLDHTEEERELDNIFMYLERWKYFTVKHFLYGQLKGAFLDSITLAKDTIITMGYEERLDGILSVLELSEEEQV